MPKMNEGFPFEFTVGNIHVNGTLRRIRLFQQLTLRNDFATYYFEQDRGRFGSEPNVARAINKVLSFALEEIFIGGHKYGIDQVEPLKNFPDLPDKEYQAKFTDRLLMQAVQVNPFLAEESPFSSLFAQYKRMLEDDRPEEASAELDPTPELADGSTKTDKST